MNKQKISNCICLSILYVLLLGCSFVSNQNNEYKFAHIRKVGLDKDVQAFLEPTITTELPSIDAHPELEVITVQNVDRIELLAYLGKGEVRALAISDDGSTIAVGTSMGVALYDVQTKQQLAFLDSPLLLNRDAKVCDDLDQGSLAFSPDGKTLAVAAEDIQIWNLETYQLEEIIQNKIEDKETLITNIQFSNTGKQIVGMQIDRIGNSSCVRYPRNFVIYGVEEGNLIFREDFDRTGELPSHYLLTKSNMVYFVMQPQDVADARYEIEKINIQTGQYLGSYYIEEIVNRYSLTENMYIQHEYDYWTDKSTDKLIDLKTGEILQEMNEHVNVLPGSTNLIFRSDYLMWVTDANGMEVCSFSKAANLGYSYFDLLDIIRDGSKAVVRLNEDGKIRILDFASCEVSEPIVEFPSAAHQFDFSPDGKRLFVSPWQSGYYQVDEISGNFEYITKALSIAFPVDNDHLYALVHDEAFLAEGNLIKIFDLTAEDKGKVENTLWVGAENMLQSEDASTFVMIEPARNGLEITVERQGRDDIYFAIEEPTDKLVLSGDGSMLMAVDRIKGRLQLTVYNTFSGEIIPDYSVMLPSTHTFVNVTKDFSLLLTASERSIFQFKLPEGSQLRRFPNNYEGWLSLSSAAIRDRITPDGNLLIIPTFDPDTLLFWDMQNGELIKQIPLFDDAHFFHYTPSFAINPDGKVIYVADDEGNIQLWGVRK